jgi:hypothetical protein
MKKRFLWRTEKSTLGGYRQQSQMCYHQDQDEGCIVFHASPNRISGLCNFSSMTKLSFNQEEDTVKEKRASNEAQDQTETAEAPIFRLPVELIQCIASYLTSDYHACLSLTCKRMMHTIGTKAWNDLTLIPPLEPPGSWSLPKRVSFLECLSRDSKGQVLCKCCEKLHRLDPPNVLPKALLKSRNCVLHHGMIYYSVTEDKGFAITGPHVVAGLVQAQEELESIQFLSGHTQVDDPRGRISYTLDFSARQVNSRLIQRIEHNICLKSIRSTWWRHGPLRLPMFEAHSLPIYICRHHNLKPSPRPWEIAKTCGALFPHGIIAATPRGGFWGWRTQLQRNVILKRGTRHTQPWVTEMNQIERSYCETGKPFVWGCVECPTKWTIEWVDRTLKIVVWKNFGNDKGLRTVWMSHVGKPNMPRTHAWLEFKTGEESNDSHAKGKI